MDSDTIWSHIDTERVALAELLDSLTAEQWRTPSLCAGWTVRDVGAHLALAQSRLGDVLLPLVRARFDFATMILRTAVESPASEEEIVATIRGFAGSRRRAPFISEVEPLIDILVHTQDICVPLGAEHEMPVEAAVVAADRMVTLNRRRAVRLREPITAVRLRATDAAWTTGDGPEVNGPMAALVMLLAGRESAALPRLSGAVDGLRRHGHRST